MESQVFVFGSFSEDEASHFQSPQKPTKQSIKENGDAFTKLQSQGIDKTIITEPATHPKLIQSGDASKTQSGIVLSEKHYKEASSSSCNGNQNVTSHLVPSGEGQHGGKTQTLENGNSVHSKLQGEISTSSSMEIGNPHPDNVLKSQGNGHGMFVSEAEDLKLSKTWADHLGLQSEFDTQLKGKAALVNVSKSTDASLRVQVTEVTGEAWLRSLKEVDMHGRRLQPRGLINTGTSCFANATLQALISCTPFLHLLRTIQARGIPQVGYPTLQACVAFFKEFELQEDNGGTNCTIALAKPFVPVMFSTVLENFNRQQINSNVGRNRQEDAQEFLSFTMDRLHEELLSLAGESNPFAAKASPSTASTSETDDWETVGPKNRTAVVRTHTIMDSALSNIFGGQLYSVVKSKGFKSSVTVQPFFVLHLDILPEAVKTLEDALRLFSTSESLEGYKTSAVKGAVVSASKSVKLQTLPRVLILHLMRFSFGAQGSSKLHKVLQFPLSLNLGRDLLANTAIGPEVRKYELVATVTHHGKDPSHGHYTADSKQADGRWLRYDDGQVFTVGTSRVLQEQAYMLFYKRAANM